MDYEEIKFDVLRGMELQEIVGIAGDDELIFRTCAGRQFKLYHEQDCCENVNIEDIVGDLDDLLYSPILLAEEVSSSEDPDNYNREFESESFTWTFYKLATVKGSVTIRWYGTSNGYYSEGVSFCEEDFSGELRVARPRQRGNQTRVVRFKRKEGKRR